MCAAILPGVLAVACLGLPRHLTAVPCLNTAGGAWVERDCATAAAAVCGTAASQVLVTVSLPASAGIADPPTPALGPATVVYAPPVPTVTLATGQPSPASASPVYFNVQFSSSVTGLAASDFIAHSGPLFSQITSLAGSGTHYIVTVELSECSRQCPPGYVPSSTAPFTTVFCARHVPAASWHDANRACAPYSLATAGDAAELAFIEEQAGAVETW